jgi:hypothetical protein
MKRGFKRREAAAYIGRSYSWLAKKAMRGDDDPDFPGPRFIRVGNKGVLYLKEDLDAWLDGCAGQPVGDGMIETVDSARVPLNV